MIMDIQLSEWKMKDPEETMKVFCDSNVDTIVPIIEEDKTLASYTEKKNHMHAIPDEGESVRTNENSHRSLRTPRKVLTQKRQHTIEY